MTNLRSKRKIQHTTTNHDMNAGGGYNKRRAVVQALFFGFVLGCCVTNMTALLRSSDEQLMFFNRAYDDHLAALPPIKSIEKPLLNHVDTTSTMMVKKTVTRIDCKTHHAENDPNDGMVEDPKKFVEKTDPHFWIALHKEYFDKMRWISLMQKGEYYETGITAQFKEILMDVQPKGIVLDVGMNIGWFTLYSRAMGHDVVGFDPNPIMHSRVCSARKYNQWGWDDNDKNNGIGSSGITTFAYGLGDKIGTLNLTTGNNPGASSFHAERLHTKTKKRLTVPVTTLDTVATEMGWFQQQQQQQQSPPPTVIHLLKIDTEGYEPWVIGGASRLLLSGLVQNIIMESSSGSDEQLSKMFRILTKAGYKIHFISGVNGDTYHQEMIEPTNQELLSEKFFKESNNRQFFVDVSCNIWWKYKPYTF